jgi:hypothetical protein
MQNVTKILFFWLVTLWYPGGDIDKIYILSISEGLVAAKPYPHPFFKKTTFFSLFISRELLSPLSVSRLSSVVRPSVNFSHFNQLLWSHWANLNQTLVKWFLDGPLPNLYPVIPISNQNGRQAKNRKKGDAILIVHCCFSISQNEVKF